jgi:hypothetical protein
MMRAILATIFVVLMMPQTASAAPDTVTICHATGSDRHVTLTIPRQAAFGQAGHFYENGTSRAGHEEDYLGPCVPDETTTTTSTTSTTSTTTTTTSVVIDTCEEVGCEETTTSFVPEVCEVDCASNDDVTTTQSVTTSTLAEGGAGTTTALSGVAALLMALGWGAIRLARR